MTILLCKILFLFIFKVQISESRTCNCDEAAPFEHTRASFIQPNRGVCISAAPSKLYMANTFFGIFKDESQLTPYTCTNREDKKTKIYMEPYFNFLIVKKDNAEEYHIIISHLYYDNIVTAKYGYKNLYHLNDFECFKLDFTNIKGEKDNFKSTFQAMLFENSYDKLRCFWFNTDTPATKELTYNDAKLTITTKKMDVRDSPIMKLLTNCDEFTNSAANVRISDRITVLGSNVNQFCVQTNSYFLDRLRRSQGSASHDNLKDYCYFESGDDTCFRVGSDFEYALFSTSSYGFKFIILPQSKYDIHGKKGDSLKTDLNVTINEIMCSTKLTYTQNMMSMMGIHDSKNNMHCIIASDFLLDHTAPHSIDSQNHNIKFFGCKTFRPTPIDEERFIKKSLNNTLICLQSGYTSITGISPVSLKLGLFMLDHTKICYNHYTSSVCYYLSPEINYVFIKSVYSNMETLIGDYDIYNRDGEEDYIYDSVYYKKEIVCAKKEHILDFEKIKSEKYIFNPSEQIKCFIVEFMDINDKIGIINNAGCPKRLIDVQPLINRQPPTYDIRNLCSPFIKPRTSDDDKMYVMSSDHIIQKCIELTCTSKIYAFSQTDFQSEKGAYISCIDRSSQCVDSSALKYLVYRVKNQVKNREIYVSSREFTININDNILYSDEYYKNEVVCFNTDKITSGNTPENIQFKERSYSCSVTNHLSNDEATITIKTTDQCSNQIKLKKHVVNPQFDGPTLHKTCENLVTDTTTAPKKVNKDILKKCIARTCTKIHYYFDLSQKQEQVSYKSQPCDINNVGNQTACLNAVSKGALMKLTSPRDAGKKILFTKDLITDISEEYYYLSFYGPEYFVCFQKSRVHEIEKIKSANSHIETTNRICFIPETMTSAVTLKLIVHSSCNRDIVMYSGDNTDARAIDTKCNDFHSLDGDKLKILSGSMTEIKDCITKLCLTLDYQIMKNGDVKNCKPETICNPNDPETKYFKIKSKYNDKNLYIIPEDASKTEILDSDKSGYYKSQFNESDFVCYKSNVLRDEDKVAIPGLIETTSTGRHCFVIKELTNSKTIELNVRPGCTRKISLVNSISTASNSIRDNANDEICKSFREEDASGKVLQMNLENLKKCVRHFCLKPTFIVKKSSTLGNFSRVNEQCDENTDSCVTDASDFDYVKLLNPYTDEVFYVQNSEMQSFALETNFFYPSPYYKNEVICIETERITDQQLTLTKSNSYIINKTKCIVINELSGEISKLEIDKNKCSRNIDLIAARQDKSTLRTIDHVICQNFLQSSPNQNTVHSTTRENMELCLRNTCLKVLSFVEIENDKTLTQSSLTECSNGQTFIECIKSDKHYDFIKVGKSGDKDFRLFRLYPSSEIDTYTTSKIEYYQSEYYKNDVVCFNSTQINEPSEWISQSGIFVEKSRVCIIADMLTHDLDIEYKLTDTYNHHVQIRKSSTTDQLENLQSLQSQCSEFFNQNPAHIYIYIYSYSMEKLKECINKTRSFVEFLVPLNTTNADYTHQKLKVCNRHTNISTCLTNVAYFDAMKVKSPYRTDSFYIGSNDLTRNDKEIYKNLAYKNTYYSDDIICIHDEYLTEPKSDQRNVPGFISFDNVNCIIIKDTTAINHITVKQFDKCSKNIHLSRYTSDTSQNSEDICAPFYAKSAPTSVVTLSLADLRSCIASTCSQLEYFTENLQNKDLFVKKLNDCDDKKKYGEISCLESAKSYFIAKVKQGNSENHFYVQQEAENDIDVKDSDSYFYSSMYYKDQMVCFNKLHLPNDRTEFNVIEKGNKNLVCMEPINTTKTTNLLIKTKNDCNKEMSFDMTKSSSTKTNAQEDECKIFHSVSNPEIKIHVMTHNNIKNCISKTCSKVESVINRNTQPNGYTSEKNTVCSSLHGDHSCITGPEYDFAYISNSYLTQPIIVRSKNYDDLQGDVSKTIFDQSVYSSEDIICQDSSLILDLESISTQEGVYSNGKRTCVIGSKIKEPLSFMLNVTGQCNRTIYVMNSETLDLTHTSMDLDSECRLFYNNSQTLIVQSQESLQKCVAHTCSTFKSIDQLPSGEKCKDGEKECDKSKQFSYGIVESPYSSREILVISENEKNHWMSLFEAPENYDSVYPSGQIVCFKNDIFTTTLSTSRKYVNDNSNMACVKPDISDKELLLTIKGGDPPAVKLMKYDDPDILSFASKKIKFILHSLHTDTKSMVEVFSHEETIDTSSDDNRITDFRELEYCLKAKKKIDKKDDFEKDDVPDLYAIKIASNILFQSPIGFFLKNSTACAKSFKIDAHLPSEKTISDTEVYSHHMQCNMIWKDMLTVKLNSEAIPESLNTENHCLTNDDLKEKCEVTYQYKEHIIICYISKSNTLESDNFDGVDEEEEEKSHELNPVYVMIKKGNCYVPKIMKYQRIAMCDLAETGLTIKVIDFDIKGEKKASETGRQSAFEIYSSLWRIFAVGGSSAPLLFFLLSRRKKKRKLEDKDLL